MKVRIKPTKRFGVPIGTYAIAASLALGMALPCVGAQPVALADETPGTVTIVAATGNENVKYKALKIFTADVDGTNTIKNINWSTSDIRSKVVYTIQSYDSSYTDEDDAAASAQKAAEFIQAHISDAAGNTPSKDNTTILAAKTFGMTLADAIDGFTSANTVSPGVKTELADGYYLFVSSDSSLSTGASATSPVFAVIGNGDLTINEKATTPTVTKTALDEAGKDKLAVDAFIGRNVTYKLTGTVAANYASYKNYKYSFTDTLSQGLTLDLSSVKVTVDGVDKTSSFTKSLKNNVLTVSISDLKAIDTAKGGSTIVVTYTAALNAKAVTGATGNDNTVALTYSNNPYSTSTGTTVSKKTRTYSYALSLHKQDKNAASRALSGAKFQIQVTENANSALNKMYVCADGTLSTSPYTFTTDTSGNISVSGLDQGKYLITETQAPTIDNGSYETIDPLTLVIDSNVESLGETDPASQSLTLSATLSGDADAVVATSVNSSEQSVGSGVDASAGTVNIVVRDTKRTTMPVTGEVGIVLPCVIGISAAGVSIFALRRKSLRANPR